MIALGSDHAGYDLKMAVAQYLTDKGIEFIDCGCYEGEACDYPNAAKDTCLKVVDGTCDKALLFCGTGIGISMAANKVKGIRAAAVSEVYSAKLTRQHNNSNIVCIGARVIGIETAKMIVDAFLNTEFEGGRHQKRVDMIIEMENE